MGEALYRKYRPQKLADIVGQDHITKTLKNAIDSNRISHGYLFAGPRGVGKTSIARILAYQLNDFPYGDTRGSLDIIEIDAASNRRIDEIRELRDKVHVAPVAGKYKVYIIDEVHMLTREAFNALLKTLEEPPAHTIFILATTEAHKLPETIVSRTQRFTFKEVNQEDMKSHLKVLAKKESITITDDALELVAEHGTGSFRDSISLLDQLSSHKEITANDVEVMLGLPPQKTIELIISYLQEGDVKQLIKQLETLRSTGINAGILSQELSHTIRKMVVQSNLDANMLKIAKALLDVPVSSDPYQLLEIQLLELCLSKATPPKAKSSVLLAVAQPTTAQETPATPKAKSGDPKPKISHPKKSDAPTLDAWKEIVQDIKKTNNTLYGLARMAEPAIEDEILVLRVPYPFHQKRLQEEKNSKIVSDLLHNRGFASTYNVVVVKKSQPEKPTESKIETSESDTLQTVTDIFGGGEVLES